MASSGASASGREESAGGVRRSLQPESPQGLRRPLLWVDCEMTGLDASRDEILEIACVLTDGGLETIIEGPSMVLAFPRSSQTRPASTEEETSVAAASSRVGPPPGFAVDPWVLETHTKSGLWEACAQSQLTPQDAEKEILAFLTRHGVREKECLLAGNSVHADKVFLAKHLPRLTAFLHYRIVDVSTVKELWNAWRPHKKPFAKRLSHRALDDIRESIAELAFYKKHFFVLHQDASQTAPL